MSRPRTQPDTTRRNHDRNQDLIRYYNTDPMIGWAKTALQNAKKRARYKGIPCNITLPDVLKAAEGITHCPITGEELVFGRGTGVPLNNAASIDRIDNEAPYAPDSIAVISMRANAIKSNATLDQMIALGRYANIVKRVK